MTQGNTQTLRTTNTYAMAVTALMTAVTCILAPLSIPIGPVPISLTNFAIYLSLYLLDWKKGTISYILYLLLGLVGLPVFSGFTGGIGKLAGPTGGYIIGFIPMAIIAGIVIDKFSQRWIQEWFSVQQSAMLSELHGSAFRQVTLYLLPLQYVSFHLSRRTLSRW